MITVSSTCFFCDNILMLKTDAELPTARLQFIAMNEVHLAKQCKTSIVTVLNSVLGSALKVQKDYLV